MKKKFHTSAPFIFPSSKLAFSFLTVLIANIAIAKPKVYSSVERVASHPQVKNALNYAVELEKTNGKLLIELNEIEAPPFLESKRAQRFAQLLKDSGLKEVRIDKVGNVIGVRPGTKTSGKRIAISAHLDTVFPPGTNVTVKQEGNKYTAPGIGDNTRGLVSVLSVLKSLQHAKIKTQDTLLFIGNVGEEGLGDLRGVRYLFGESNESIDEIVVIDGGSRDRIVTSGVGSHRYRVTFNGPGGHSWGSFGLANPHHALGRAIALFDQNAWQLVLSTNDKVSYNIGRIGGGTSINSIPFESWFEVDIRSTSQTLIESMDNTLHTAVNQALSDENRDRKKGESITVEFTPVGKRPAAIGNPEWALTKTMKNSLTYLGIQPRERASSTDASIPISIGIPALTISRGGTGGNAHSLEEYWINDKAYLNVQAALLTLVTRAGLEEK